MGAFFDAMDAWNRHMKELESATRCGDRARVNNANQALDNIIGPLFNAVASLQDREDRLVFDLTTRLDRAEGRVAQLQREVERLRQQ